MLDQIKSVLRDRLFNRSAMPVEVMPERLPSIWVEFAPLNVNLSDSLLWERVLLPAMTNLCERMAHERCGVSPLGATWCAAIVDWRIRISVVTTDDRDLVVKSFLELV